MNKVSIIITLIISFFLFSPLTSQVQEDSTAVYFEVNRQYPDFSVTPAELDSAQTLIDFNKFYDPKWVKTYKSVEIITKHDGRNQITNSKDHILTEEQKAYLHKADFGSDIEVLVKYIPDNTLSGNDIKEVNFSFTVDPEQPATFIGGQEKLHEYLKTTAVNQLTESQFREYGLAAISFTIDEKGKVNDANIATSSEDPDIDNLLLDVICKMPTWDPAKFSDATPTQQDFVFMVGDMRSCSVNLLNVRKTNFEEEN